MTTKVLSDAFYRRTDRRNRMTKEEPKEVPKVKHNPLLPKWLRILLGLK